MHGALSKVKSLIVSLKNVNIDKVLKSAPVVAAVPVAAPVAAPAQEEKEEKKEASEEEIASGLGALFG
jgi:LSU ribosomal protein L12AE